MRVSTGQMQNYILQGLGDQGARYAEASRQMATGDRILRPSDDPLGTVKLLGLEREQKSLEQYQTNISTVTSRLNKAETYLQASVDVLMRINDLTLAAVNGSNSDSDRVAAAQELRNLHATLLDTANARGEEGEYLFSGSQLRTPAVALDGLGNYVYQGDGLTREVSVAKGVAVSSNDTAENLFFDAAGNLFDDLDDFIDALNTPGAPVTTEGHAMLERFDRTLGQVNHTLTDIGGRLNTLAQLGTAQEDLALANQKIIGEISDLDYAEVMMRVSQIELALTATQKTYANINQLSLFDYF